MCIRDSNDVVEDQDSETVEPQKITHKEGVKALEAVSYTHLIHN